MHKGQGHLCSTCNKLGSAAIVHRAAVDRVLLRAQVRAELATRVVPSAVVAKWRKELERLQPQVDEVLQVRTYLYTCHNDIIQSEFLCEMYDAHAKQGRNCGTMSWTLLHW